MFRSLFSWTGLLGPASRAPTTRAPTGFDPCSPGPVSWAWWNSDCRGALPMFRSLFSWSGLLGMSPEDRRSLLLRRFRSLFSWTGLLGMGGGEDHIDHTLFRSLFSWTGLLGLTSPPYADSVNDEFR